jgi:hypothetical protein
MQLLNGAHHRIGLLGRHPCRLPSRTSRQPAVGASARAVPVATVVCALALCLRRCCYAYKDAMHAVTLHCADTQSARTPCRHQGTKALERLAVPDHGPHCSHACMRAPSGARMVTRLGLGSGGACHAPRSFGACVVPPRAPGDARDPAQWAE